MAVLLVLSTGIVGAGLGLAALQPAGAKQQRPKPLPAEAREIIKVGAQTEIPLEVRQALERNARALAPIALTLEKQRTAPQPPSNLTRAILDTFTGILKPCTYEYLSQDGRCYGRYNQWIRPVMGTSLSVWQELSWDGKNAYLGAESLQPQALEIVPIARADEGNFKNVSWYHHDDYFGMIGIAVPCKMVELPQGPRSEVLGLLAANACVT
jgi:hypothetical protein